MTVDPAVAVVTVGVILLMGALIGASMSVKSWLRSIVLETIGPKIDLQAASVARMNDEIIQIRRDEGEIYTRLRLSENDIAVLKSRAVER
jgi:hypothetical protein